MDTTLSKPLWMRFRVADNPADEVLSHFGIRTPPVPVRGIAHHLGVEVLDVNEAAAGVLDARDMERVVIHVRDVDPEVRKRFTIAHELGHLLLHRLGVRFRDLVVGSNTKEERQANVFAANLLMPEWMFRPAFRWFDGDMSAIAEFFQVSKPAAEIRFMELYGPTGR